MKIECLLWDCGDTLFDELSLWRVSPEWMEVYRSFDDDGGIGAAWSQGDLDTHEVVAKLAKRMPLTEDQILTHLSRTDLFEFFPFTYPALFRKMALDLSFDKITDTIVVSGEERTVNAFFRSRYLPQAIVTVNKGALCEIAMQRMPIACANEHALLIDNKQVNLDAWAARGGTGYLYTTDQAFERDVADGIDGLVHR